jgi:hypothetical protein
MLLQAPQQDLPAIFRVKKSKFSSRGLEEHEAGSCDDQQVVLSRTELNTYAHDIERTRLQRRRLLTKVSKASQRAY